MIKNLLGHSDWFYSIIPNPNPLQVHLRQLRKRGKKVTRQISFQIYLLHLLAIQSQITPIAYQIHIGIQSHGPHQSPRPLPPTNAQGTRRTQKSHLSKSPSRPRYFLPSPSPPSLPALSPSPSACASGEGERCTGGVATKVAQRPHVALTFSNCGASSLLGAGTGQLPLHVSVSVEYRSTMLWLHWEYRTVAKRHMVVDAGLVLQGAGE
jgi:hypothetical protein